MTTTLIRNFVTGCLCVSTIFRFKWSQDLKSSNLYTDFSEQSSNSPNINVPGCGYDNMKIVALSICAGLFACCMSWVPCCELAAYMMLCRFRANVVTALWLWAEWKCKCGLSKALLRKELLMDLTTLPWREDILHHSPFQVLEHLKYDWPWFPRKIWIKTLVAFQLILKARQVLNCEILVIYSPHL